MWYPFLSLFFVTHWINQMKSQNSLYNFKLFYRRKCLSCWIPQCYGSYYSRDVIQFMNHKTHKVQQNKLVASAFIFHIICIYIYIEGREGGRDREAVHVLLIHASTERGGGREHAVSSSCMHVLFYFIFLELNFVISYRVMYTYILLTFWFHPNTGKLYCM